MRLRIIELLDEMFLVYGEGYEDGNIEDIRSAAVALCYKLILETFRTDTHSHFNNRRNCLER